MLKALKFHPMKFLRTLIFILTLSESIHAQTPFWQWGREGIANGEGYAVAADSYGNAIYTGQFLPTYGIFGEDTLTGANHEVFIVKYDGWGNVLWAKQSACIEPTGGAHGMTIATDKDDNIYVSGYYIAAGIQFDGVTLDDGGNADIFLVKYDPDGNVLWAKGFGSENDEFVYGITADNADNVIITGGIASPEVYFDSDTLFASISNDEFFVAKLNTDGNVVWARQSFGGPGYMSGYSVTTDSSENIYATGFMKHNSTFGPYSLTMSPALEDVFTVKYDADGNEMWAVKSSGSTGGLTESWSVDYMPAGQIITTGFYKGVTTFDGTDLPSPTINFHGFLTAYDLLGNLLWSKSFLSDTGPARGFSVTADLSSNIFISGEMDSIELTLDTLHLAGPENAASDPMFIIKCNSSGDALWGKTLASGGDDQSSLAVTTNGSIYVAGDFLCEPFVVGYDSLHLSGLESPFLGKLTLMSNVNITSTDPKNNNISVFPNPAEKEIFIDAGSEVIENVRLFNLNGQDISVITTAGNGIISVDISVLQPGCYFLQINSATGSTTTQFIKL